MTIDAVALRRSGAELAGYGLLALAFRDLAEGDIPLGYGASKGYGAVRAEVFRLEGPDGAIPFSNRAAAQGWVEALERELEVASRG